MLRRPYVCQRDESPNCDAGTCRDFGRCRIEDDGVCLARDRDESMAEDAADAKREDAALGL